MNLAFRIRSALALLAITASVGCPAPAPTVTVSTPEAAGPMTPAAPRTAPPTDAGAVRPGATAYTDISGRATLAGNAFANATLRVEDAFANTAVAVVGPDGTPPISGLFVDASTLKTDADGRFTVKVGNMSPRDLLRVVATSNGQVLTALMTGGGSTGRQYDLAQSSGGVVSLGSGVGCETSSANNDRTNACHTILKVKNQSGRRCTPGRIVFVQVQELQSLIQNKHIEIDDEFPIQNITGDAFVANEVLHYIMCWECPRVVPTTAPTATPTPTPTATATTEQNTAVVQTAVVLNETTTALELIAREVLRMASALTKDAASHAIDNLVNSLNVVSPEMTAAFAADPSAALNLANSTSNSTTQPQNSPVLTGVLAQNRIVQGAINRNVAHAVSDIASAASNVSNVVDSSRLVTKTLTGANIKVDVDYPVVTVTNVVTGATITVTLKGGVATTTEGSMTFIRRTGNGSGGGGNNSTSSSLSGRVTIGHYLVSGAKVALYRDGALVAQTVSGSDGSYTFSDLRSGTYTLVFAADGAQSVTQVVTI